jgi:hypothetical protein
MVNLHEMGSSQKATNFIGDGFDQALIVSFISANPPNYMNSFLLAQTHATQSLLHLLKFLTMLSIAAQRHDG